MNDAHDGRRHAFRGALCGSRRVSFRPRGMFQEQERSRLSEKGAAPGAMLQNVMFHYMDITSDVEGTMLLPGGMEFRNEGRHIPVGGRDFAR